MHPAIPIIAQIARVDTAGISPERTLNSLGLSSSLGLSILRSGLNRRLGCGLGPLEWRMTIRELLAAVDGGGTAAAPAGEQVPPVPTPPRARGPLGGPRRQVWAQALPLHGVDIEDIGAMPAWPPSEQSRAFYDAHFTAGELAHAGRQSDPRATLCGCWCAKEAVKKCSPELLLLDWREIEVSWAADGRPSLQLLRASLSGAWEFSLSISHSATSAVASVLACRRDGR